MDESELNAILDRWWYYSIELAPGRFSPGANSPLAPMMPRMILRGANLEGMSCLDCGTMEGLMPTLMKRRGAKDVLAVDAVDHCVEKMSAVKRAYGVDFDYQRVGLMYELGQKLEDRGGFDLINLSGLLYHVFSPLHVLAQVRSLLKKNGLMIISTNMVARPDYTMEFNAAGRLQTELNTFWYISIPTMEQMLHAVQLKPIDVLYWPMGNKQGALGQQDDFPVGFMSVICRAVDADEIGDPWLQKVRRISWEFSLLDRAKMEAQPRSDITYVSERNAPPIEPETLHQRALSDSHRVLWADKLEDTHSLSLDHYR